MKLWCRLNSLMMPCLATPDRNRFSSESNDSPPLKLTCIPVNHLALVADWREGNSFHPTGQHPPTLARYRYCKVTSDPCQPDWRTPSTSNLGLTREKHWGILPIRK